MTPLLPRGSELPPPRRDIHREFEAAAYDLLYAARTWLSETNPGMRINTAKGRGATRRAAERFAEIIDERDGHA